MNAVEQPFTVRMSALYAELQSTSERHGGMPDDAMDRITEAASIVSKAIINAPVTCEADVAGKLRHAAQLVDSPHGVWVDEEPAVAGALADLQLLRIRQWQDVMARAS